MEVVPYIETIGSEKFKIFLNQEFSINMLYNISNNPTSIVLFDEWRGKNMGTWNKFTNDDGVILEFYPEHYTIQVSKYTRTFPNPITLNDFINDMCRIKIRLNWNEWININFEPKEFLQKNKIRDYYSNLLKRMNKSHELL